MELKSKKATIEGLHSKAAIIQSISDIHPSQLMKLFEDELKDVYWAEKALTKALAKMIKNAKSGDLKEALQKHLGETEGHVKRVEEVFGLIDKKANARKCQSMAGLIDEAGEIMNECEEGAMRDAGIISAGQKVAHYEIATYGTLCQFAKTLDLNDVANLLEETLKEEKAADRKLSEIAMNKVNEQASKEREA